MKPRKNPSESRHGKLKQGRTQTSLTIDKDLLDKAKQAADADGRSLSNWLEQLVRNTAVPKGAASIAKLVSRETPSPTPPTLPNDEG